MAYDRISARRGSVVNLDARFLKGGQLADPFAIYRVEIYRGSVAAENIVEIFTVHDPSATDYPSPIIHGNGTGTPTGIFSLPWTVPHDAVVPDVYFDQWYWYSTNPHIGTVTDLSHYESQLLKQCNRFWVYPDDWYIDGGLQTINLAFEPLNQKYNKPEVRPLEIGLMPLPLYDYDFNLVTPLIPYLNPTISIWTENYEPIITNAVAKTKLRQGSFKSNPFVVSYLLDTSGFFIGTYKYRVTLHLPDGTTRISQDLYFTIS